MAGQIWATDAEGGYLYSDQLSDVLRLALQPLCKFRQLCDADDGTKKEAHAGDTYSWNVISDISTQGRRLAERETIPESDFQITQHSMTLQEAGNSVPYTGKLSTLAKQDLVALINKTLRQDARKYFDIEAYLQFDECALRAVPTSGTSTNSLTITTNGSTATTNNVAMGADHIKALVDYMQEANIPPFEGDDYGAIGHPTTFRPVVDDLEAINQYTSEGIGRIYAGEIGRYENVRFIRQNHIPKGGAIDSTTFDPWTGTADAWNNAKSSWAFFFGSDTVTEGIVVPEEIRAKIPTDFGRSRALAWYYLGGFGIIHSTSTNGRIIKWDSAA